MRERFCGIGVFGVDHRTREPIRKSKPGQRGEVSGAALGARGSEAFAATAGRAPAPGDAGALLRLDSNENPVGPCPAALDAIRAAFGEAGRYPRITVSSSS